MVIDQLTASLILGWMSFIGVEAYPMSEYIIELSACGTNSDTVGSFLSQECLSTCESVIRAQQSCERDARCTCSNVSPAVLDSCIHCAISGLSEDHILKTGMFIPMRIDAYSEVCGPLVNHRALEVTPVNLTMPSSNDENAASSSLEVSGIVTHASKRELDSIRCVFGLPEVVGSRWPNFSQATRSGPWPVLFFIAVAVLCYAENRRSKATSKAQQ